MESLQHQGNKVIEYRTVVARKTCTIKELAEAFEISEAKARQLVRTKDFPKIKIGRNTRIVIDKLDNWLEEHLGDCI